MLLIRLPPSDLLHASDRTVHAYEREPSVCLFPCNEYWRYSMRWEQELKAQFYKVKKRKRLFQHCCFWLSKQCMMPKLWAVIILLWNFFYRAFLDCWTICFLFYYLKLYTIVKSLMCYTIWVFMKNKGERCVLVCAKVVIIFENSNCFV